MLTYYGVYRIIKGGGRRLVAGSVTSDKAAAKKMAADRKDGESRSPIHRNDVYYSRMGRYVVHPLPSKHVDRLQNQFKKEAD